MNTWGGQRVASFFVPAVDGGQCRARVDSFAVNPISERVRGVFSDAIKVSEAVPKLCDSFLISPAS